MRPVLLKDTSRRKFTELVTNHVLGHEDGLKNLSVMDEKGMADKIRRYHRAPRPCLDRFFGVRIVHLIDLLQKMRFDEGSFLQRSGHKNQIPLESGVLRLLLGTSPLHDETVARLVLRAGFKSFRQLAPRAHRVMASTTAL